MKTSPHVFQDLAQRFGWALLHSLWQGLLVAALLVIVLHVLRHASAAARHVACVIALAALLACVVVTACKVEPAPMPGKLPATPATNATPMLSSREPEPASAEAMQPLEPGGTSEPVSSTTQEAPKPPQFALPWRAQVAPLLPWIAGCWMTGVLLLSLRHAGGWIRVRALRRRDVSAAPEGAARIFAQLTDRLALRRAARLLASVRAATPMLIGVLKPVVLMPMGVLAGLGPRELEAILAHELAHLARGDAWANLFQVIVETVLFYHPAVWWIGHRARIEREHAADDLAVRLCADRLTYAGALARLAELAAVPPLALAATGGSLLARIRRIATPPVRPEPAGGWAAGALVLAAAAALLLPFVPMNAADAAIHVTPGQSIQSAIDTAPSGAVIHLDAGEWKERITISKPLTLEGEGWGKTTILIDEPSRDEISKAYAELDPQLKAASSDEEKERLELEWQRRVVRPAVLVHSDGPVHLRKLRVHAYSQQGYTGSVSQDTLVVFHRSAGTMDDCAVVGPYMNGIYVTQKSDVEIRHSLVAALWGEGIVAVGNRSGGLAPARLRLSDSEVRNVCHYGIAIGRGCDTTLVERCRISGTAWHGIRYDDASPTITGNTIFGHARSGIYASGKTHATVRGNLFWKNEMDGISCWFDNTDTIEGNTFVGNLREGLAVIGAKPTVEHNVFVDNPIAITCSATSSRDGKTTPAGEPVVTANLFWNNKVVMTAAGGEKPAPDGSLSADPKFRDASKQDFALAPDSPAKQANTGSAEPLTPAGPWPLLAEERAIIPVDETRDYQYWSAPGAPKKSKAAEKAAATAAADAKDWVADAFQLDDKAKREAAIERVRTAMASADAGEQRTGIIAFGRLGPIEFDKASFRPLARELLKSQDVTVRAGAASAFTMTGADPEDLPHIFALADDAAPEVRDSLTYIIVALTKYDLTGKEASDAILKLMAKLPKDARSVAHALWGAKFSPEIEAKVLEFCRDIDGFEVGYNFFYGALSTQANKSEASVKRLIEILANPDTTNKAGRAAWGLQQGVDKAQYPLVADAMLRVVEARSEGYLRNNALRVLRSYGSATQAAPLKELLAKPGVTGDLKKQLEEALAEIEKRPAAQ